MCIKNIKVLVIANDPDNLLIINDRINIAIPEAEVFKADGGASGIAAALKEDPDIILIDELMSGMDGSEVCKKLKDDSRSCDIPVIFITTLSSDSEMRLKALKYGAEGFLSKPLDLVELIAQIRTMVKIKEANIRKRNAKELFEELINVRNANEHLEKLIDCTNTFIIVWDMDLKIRRVNEAFQIDTGYKKNELLGFDLNKIFASEKIKEIMDLLIRREDGEKLKTVEMEIICFDGSLKTVLWSFSAVYDDQAAYPTSAMAHGQDITERKKAEEQIRYMGYHDHLTGLYNRRFYEEEVKRLDTKRNLPLTIIMGDVNGLKLINDSFGYAKGDELLRKTAAVIKKGCRTDDIIARLGGDEFVVLLSKTDSDKAEEIIERIRMIASKTFFGAVNISISFGYGVKHHEFEKIHEILKNAEDQMFRRKMYESPSMRSKTIDLIMETLFAKSTREMMHSKRVSGFCEAIAKKLGLGENEVNELKIAGLMHDIGKIGIDENFLDSARQLGEKGWNEMKKHPEIGSRILGSVHEFSEMADYILEHHERMDGKGYPKGLKEEEISLKARIISIADAFDGMTSERPYKTIMSRKDAIEEMRRCAGSQLDKKIVELFIEEILKQIE